ncbi:MAG: hypothetical protein ACH346_06875 [Chthoniobacterales bacterium]
MKISLEAPPKTSIDEEAIKHTSLTAQEKKPYLSENPTQSSSEQLLFRKSPKRSLKRSVKTIPHSIACAVLFCLLAHAPVPWKSSSSLENTPSQNQELAQKLHLEKTTLAYDPALDLTIDPDGRCGTGMVKGYTMGTFASYDNIPQMLGGVVGTVGSYATPVVGEGAFIRDIGGSVYQAGKAGLDMLNNGLNWQNGTQFVFSGVAGILGGGAMIGTFAKAADMAALRLAGQAGEIGEVGTGIKYIGKLEDLQGIPRSQTLLEQLPDLGSSQANYYQNSSVLRGTLRNGYEIQDASAFRANSSPDPTLLRPDRTVGQSFLGAERNILSNKGFILNSKGVYIPQ